MIAVTKLSRSCILVRVARSRISQGRIFISKQKFGTNVQKQQQQDPLKVFKDNSTKWWSGKEFSILRSMNEIRVPFVVDGLNKPINECKILDVGCGGGILSEPLARLGANVLGIDPVFESINQAQIHAQTDERLKDHLKYLNCNIEDLSPQAEQIEAYDALVASEVLEHIEDIESFLIHCTKVIKPGGSLFITTINQTPLSWLGVIFFGEYVLQQLPKGTHTYDMFVSVKGLRVMLERLGYHVQLVNGFMYEPIGGKFYWTPSTLTHYAMQAVKVASPSAKGINYEQRRNFPAKASSKKVKLNRPKTPLEYSEMSQVIPMDIYNSKSNLIFEDFKTHLEKNLTTRATTNSIETVKVKLDGLDEALELRDIAQISMKGTNLIVINLSTMPEAVRPTMNALNELGNMNPQCEVNNIFVQIPRVTREHRDHLVSLAKQSAVGTKDKLKALFSEYSSKAKRLKSAKSGVSDDLIFNVVDNLHYDLQKRLLEVDNLLETRTKQLLNQS